MSQLFLIFLVIQKTLLQSIKIFNFEKLYGNWYCQIITKNNSHFSIGVSDLQVQIGKSQKFSINLQYSYQKGNIGLFFEQEGLLVDAYGYGGTFEVKKENTNSLSETIKILDTDFENYFLMQNFTIQNKKKVNDSFLVFSKKASMNPLILAMNVLKIQDKYRVSLPDIYFVNQNQLFKTSEEEEEYFKNREQVHMLRERSFQFQL